MVSLEMSFEKSSWRGLSQAAAHDVVTNFLLGFKVDIGLILIAQLSLFLLSSCAGSQVRTSVLPPSFEVSTPFSEIVTSAQNMFNTTEEAPDFNKVFTRDNVSGESTSKYHLKFYESGYLSSVTMPAWAKEVRIILNNGRVAILSFAPRFVSEEKTVSSGECIVFSKDAIINLYQPNGLFKSITFQGTDLSLEFSDDGQFILKKGIFHNDLRDLMMTAQCQ
jgi:hypothetical protein